MPLPQPTYPPYQPRSFLDEGGQELVSLATKLYSSYHPAATQQRIYQSILEDKQFQEGKDVEKIAALRRELQSIQQQRALFREAGLGQAGKAGTSKGFSKKSTSSVKDVSSKWGEIQTDRLIASEKASIERLQLYQQAFRVPGSLAIVSNAIIRDLERAKADGNLLTDAVVENAIADATERYQTSISVGRQLQREEKIAAAERLFSEIRTMSPHLIENKQGFTNKGKGIAKILDKVYATGDWLYDKVSRNVEPADAITEERVALMAGQGIGAGSFERMMEGRLKDIDGDGEISEDERQAAREQMEAMGIAAPLSVEEQMFLRRYTEALRDDGVATREELGEDYDKAKAAYDRGAVSRNIPMGAAPFYDESYLQGLARAPVIQKELAALEKRMSPQQAAARQTLGLPEVPIEALNAAASISPIAAESLPWAMKRVRDSGGNVEPRDSVEAFTQKIINTQHLRSPGDRDFQEVIRAVNKKYGNDLGKRRQAFAYYGAKNYATDVGDTTLNDGYLTGDPEAAATESAHFINEVTRGRDTQAAQQQAQFERKPGGHSLPGVLR